MGDGRRRGREAESGNARLALEARKSMETRGNAPLSTTRIWFLPRRRLSSTARGSTSSPGRSGGDRGGHPERAPHGR
jgi:hypothetical protein